jgi:hypothetical protein
VQTEKTAQVVFADTGARGIYELTMAPTATPKKPAAVAAPPQTGRRELFAVNVDTRESDLESLDEKALQTTTFAGIPYIHHSEWSAGSRDLADSGAERSGLSVWLLIAVLALLLVEPLMAWSFRHGFILLCTFAICGLVAPWTPRNAVGAVIIAAILAGGVVAIVRYGRERKA